MVAVLTEERIVLAQGDRWLQWLLRVEGPLHGIQIIVVVVVVARNREPEAYNRTVGQMVAVVRIVLWSILNVFFKIYLLSFAFVSLSWARLVWSLSTRVFSHFWSFKRFLFLTLCIDCESVTFHFLTLVSCPCHMQ